MICAKMRSLATLAALILAAVLATPCGAQNLRIRCMDVGQGDATVIITPGNRAVVIDGGRSDGCGDDIYNLLSTYGITRIEYIIPTHYDMDHIAGLDRLISRIGSVGAAYDRGAMASPTTYYTAYVNALATKGVPRHTITAGTVLTLDGVTFTCLCVNGSLMGGGSVSVSDENDLCAGLLVSYGGFDFMILGDASSPVEEAVGDLCDGDPGDPVHSHIDVHHTSHHGSDASSGLSFLNDIRAEVAIISVGDSGTCGPGFNSYGHPTQAAIDNLYSSGVRHIYQTEEDRKSVV